MHNNCRKNFSYRYVYLSLLCVACIVLNYCLTIVKDFRYSKWTSTEKWLKSEFRILKTYFQNYDPSYGGSSTEDLSNWPNSGDGRSRTKDLTNWRKSSYGRSHTKDLSNWRNSSYGRSHTKDLTNWRNSSYGRSSTEDLTNWRNLSQEQIKSLSNLGRRLYLSEEIGTVKEKNFTIHVWKSYYEIMPRYLKQYGDKLLDPFRLCSVRNCKFTHQDADVHKADAVLVHLHRSKGLKSFPERKNFKQRWIWLTDEAPYPTQTFPRANDKNFSHYNGYFNWSMSYRMDSDIPVPYGRTVRLSEYEASKHKSIDYFDRKPKLAAVMGSDASQINRRWDYVRELGKHMRIDFYGKLGTLTCPGRMTKDCKLLFDYKFYLAFENGNCMEYITEKLWWNAIEHGAVPVVLGTKVEDYHRLLPPGSFIHIDEFRSPLHLAQYILSVSRNRTLYMKYHEWRSHYAVTNEHGYAGADVYHYCRICEALNYNDPAPKVYNNLEVFWNSETQCYPPTWQKKMERILDVFLAY